MQPELRSHRRFRDHKAIRLVRRSAPGVVAAGAVLVMLGGSQGFAMDQFPAARSNLEQVRATDTADPLGRQTGAGSAYQSAQQSAQPTGGSIDGGSPPPAGASAPPDSGSPGSGSAGANRTSSAASSPTSAVNSPPVVGGVRVPGTVYAAYLNAAQRLAGSQPGCHLPWQLLAAIGQVESGQADGGNVTADGTVRAPILGPPLNGRGFAAIRSADGSWVRAEGPMQFIPSTWAVWGTDGNSDGRADPQNVFDAALSAADYLCSGGRDLSNSADLNQAILGYNGTQAYLTDVLAWLAYFQHTGTLPGPNATGPTGGSSPAGANPASPSRNSGDDKSDDNGRGGKSRIKPGNDSTKTPSPSTRPTSKSPSPTASPTRTAHPSPTSTPATASPTPSATPTSAHPSASPSGKPSPSGSASPSPSGSPSPTCSAPSPSGEPTSSASPTATASPSPSDSATPSDAPTPTATPTSDCH